MKIGITLAVLVILSAGGVSADTNVSDEVNNLMLFAEEQQFSDAGVLPGNFQYMLKRFGERVRLVAAVDPVKDSALRFEFAERRLAEANALAARNSSLAGEYYMEYEERLMDAVDIAERRVQEGKFSLEDTKNLGDRLELHQRIIAIKDSAPESAGYGLSRALNVTDAASEKVQMGVGSAIDTLRGDNNNE